MCPFLLHLDFYYTQAKNVFKHTIFYLNYYILLSVQREQIYLNRVGKCRKNIFLDPNMISDD